MADRYDEHGRQIIHTAATGEPGSYMYGSDAPVSGVPHGTTGGAPVGAGEQHGAGKEQHGVSGILHRSTSSSSSSSEDDGMGGRRKKKKGLKEKIKEKLPAGHKEKQHAEAGGQPGHPQEKKGVIEKIKEKLPGHN